MIAPPLAFKWDGEAMRPLNPKRAAATYEQRIYWLEESSQRSLASHAHQFAWLQEAWRQLPESVAEAYPSPEHLRKAALIETGFFTEAVIDAGSKAAALRVAAYCRGEDEFAHVVTRGPLVVVRKARSQALRAMGKEEFQASKTAILERIAVIIGVKPEELQGRAA